jgi:hypothetical protein
MSNVRPGPWPINPTNGSHNTRIPEPRYDEPMNIPPREELDVKLQLIETRMDRRVALIEAKIDTLSGVLTERFKAMDERMGRIEGDANETKTSVSSLKTTLVVTAVATVLAVAALNATVLSNMTASFESGKSTAAAQADVKRQSEATEALLRKLQSQIDGESKERAEPAK